MEELTTYLSGRWYMKVTGSSEEGNEHPGAINCGKFLD